MKLFPLNRGRALIILGACSATVFLGTHFYWDGDRILPEERRWAGDPERPIPDPSFDQMLNYSQKPDGDPPDAIKSEETNLKHPTLGVYSAPVPVMPAKLAATPKAPDTPAATDAAQNKPAASPTVERTDPYRTERVLVATVGKGVDTAPGDRLLWTRVFIQPINFRFADYQIASTATGVIKLAEVENTEAVSFTFDPGLPKAPAPTPKSTDEQTHKATSQINLTYERLGVDIQPDLLQIFRESAPGLDVSGNTRIKLSILTDPELITSKSPARKADPRDQESGNSIADHPILLLKNVSDDADRDSEIDGEPKIMAHPQNALLHCALKARVWMLYEQRKIRTGGNAYLEGVQHVQLVQGYEPVREVDIVPADDISPAVWAVRKKWADSNNHLPIDEPFLTAKTATPGSQAMPRRVMFTDYTTASDLAHWLRSQTKTELGGIAFQYDPTMSLEPVKNAANLCHTQKSTGMNSASR